MLQINRSILEENELLRYHRIVLLALASSALSLLIIMFPQVLGPISSAFLITTLVTICLSGPGIYVFGKLFWKTMTSKKNKPQETSKHCEKCGRTLLDNKSVKLSNKFDEWVNEEAEKRFKKVLEERKVEDE